MEMIGQERRETILNRLSSEEVRSQNREAYDYLKGLLGSLERRLIGSEVALIQAKNDEFIGVVIKDKIVSRENPQGSAYITEQAYWISPVDGLVSVDIDGIANLSSGLIRRFNIRHEVGIDIGEESFLPGGKDSSRTGAKIIAEKVRGHSEAEVVNQ